MRPSCSRYVVSRECADVLSEAFSSLKTSGGPGTASASYGPLTLTLRKSYVGKDATFTLCADWRDGRGTYRVAEVHGVTYVASGHALMVGAEGMTVGFEVDDRRKG